MLFYSSLWTNVADRGSRPRSKVPCMSYDTMKFLQFGHQSWNSCISGIWFLDFPFFINVFLLLLLFLSSLAFRVFRLPMYYVGVAGQRMLCVYYPVWWHVIALSTMYNSISVSRFHYHGACISQIKNLHGDGMSWMPMGRKTGLMWTAHTVISMEGYAFSYH